VKETFPPIIVAGTHMFVTIDEMISYRDYAGGRTADHQFGRATALFGHVRLGIWSKRYEEDERND
jgi:hypothetical protein